jgi:HlyD family secretion protein
MTIAGVSAVVLLVVGSIVFTSGKSKLNVDTERITISDVKKGSFQEIIPLNGIVLPVTTIYLDAIEGGRVEKLFVEDGATMVKGQPILKLANTDLELSLANEETAVFNVLTQMQISRDNARQNTISKLNQMAEVESGLKEAERIYKLNKRLYDQKAIGLQEYQKSENDYQYATATNQQTQQSRESYAHMKSTLELMRKKVGDLIVRAPVDGQLTSLDAEIGQSKQKGGRLGQIDVLSGFKVRVDVDEHYITRVFNGQTGEFTLGDKVSNGRFQVDMQFVGALPKDVRRGQSLQIRLALSDETQAVLVPKGGFYQQTGGNWIFKLSDDGKTAYKVDVQLGRQNPDYYEVMQGLKAGDRVVTSSYENYGDMQELVLK